jgi:hypothetical protein
MIVLIKVVIQNGKFIQRRFNQSGTMR